MRPLHRHGNFQPMSNSPKSDFFWRVYNIPLQRGGGGGWGACGCVCVMGWGVRGYMDVDAAVKGQDY